MFSALLGWVSLGLLPFLPHSSADGAEGLGATEQVPAPAQ